MHARIILFGLFALFCVVSGQQGICEIALNGGQGQCKSIFNCQPLLSIVNKANKTLEDKTLLKRSHCGIDGDAPAVCCPEQNESSQCYTPEGKKGQCINLHSCSSLLNLLNPPVSNAKLEFVRNSKCYGKDQYSVCCGPVPNVDSVTEGKCNPSAFPPDPRTKCCGVDSRIYNKIYAGNKTKIDQDPWLAMIEFIQNDGTLKVDGSGALISALYVLTVASGTISKSLGKPVNIRLGEFDASNDGPDCVLVDDTAKQCNDGAIRIRIEKIISHPQYDPENNKILNDIALIRMSRMAPYTDFITPICLPTTDVTLRKDSFYLTAAGWGIIGNAESENNNIRSYIDLPHVSRDKCQSAYNKIVQQLTIGKGHLCAGGEENKDACRGGNVLMYRNDMTYEYSGILSFGPKRCGIKDIPTVYTNVYVYNSWIRSTIVP